MQSLVLISIVCFNGFLALSEMAIATSKKLRLQRMVDEGCEGASVALALAESPTRFLASMQICLTVLGIMAGVHGGATLADSIETWLVRSVPSLEPWAHPIGMTGVVAFETFIMVFFGELLPKRLALIAPENIAVRVAPVMFRVGQTLSPVADILGRMTEAVLSRLPALAKATDAHTVTEDELKMIVEQGAEEGMLDRNEETMIKRVLQFGEITAQDLMTPRTKVVGINLDDPDSENVEKIFDSSHSKFPVYRGSIDNLVGVLSVKKLFERLYRDGAIDIQACMTEPLFLPDSARADKVLDAMKQRSTHMAVLIDEFGGTAGVVTATDIVSAVMGEVPQDSVEHTPKFILRDDGSFLVDGMASLFELSERLEIETADLEDVGQTVSGLIMHLAKDIPTEGQKVSFNNWTFEVVDMDGNRIDKVLAHPIKQAEFKDSGVAHEDSDR